jgi:protein-tyrosine phosphatase
MEHVYWVIDRLLAGRPGPVLKPWQPAELYAGGLRTVVSLAAEEDVENLAPYGLTHCRAKFPPTTLYSTSMQKAFIYQALPVWAFIHDQLSRGNPTLVHCHAGQDRTGAVLAGYLITYRGVQPARALQRLREVKPTAMTAEGFAELLELLKPGVIPDRRSLL